jgi:PAS domain S-box-containing protein
VWEDGDRVFCRGWRLRADGSRSAVLAVLPAAEHPPPASLDRLTHEYELKDEIDGAWAVRPLELGREGGRTMLVLEDPGGEPLERLLGTPMEVESCLRLAIGIAAALGKVHQHGLVHKDVKPANILVNCTDGQVRLTGFGIASRLPRERQAPEPPEIIAGTLAYMAPEQTGRMNRSIDTRSDLYSLGVLLYQMLTGRLPFTASDPMEWVHCHIARQPAPPVEQRKEVPGAISAIVMKLLAKMAEERYQTAAGLECDLWRCLAQWEAGRHIDNFPLAERDTPDHLLIPEKLYGRAPEIDALIASFDRVVASGTPELVLVSGYSGIGKSSVVNELHKVLVPPRGLFASGKFDQYKRDIPYSTLAQAFQGLVRQILGKQEQEVARWRAAIREALGPNGQLLVPLIPELELIIGPQPPVPALPPQDAQTRFQMVFRQFLGVFAHQEHPLALFLDDLQWLDIATLKLLEHLVTHPETRYVLLIGAYRDNEVGLSHPLMLTLDSIRKTQALVREIVLSPLGLADVSRLVADALLCQPVRAEPLARLVYEKTAGNPFFAIQFLTALAEEHLLELDGRAAAWRWDMARIRAKGFTDNVVDLMIGKLNRLPDATQEALKQLACLGNRATIATLRLVHGGSEEAMHADLWEAVRAGLALRTDGAYTFLHDRVHEAAYSLIPDERRPGVHLRIGRLLLCSMAANEIADTLFDVINQLNVGVPLLADRDEKERVAELNLRAGRKAKASTAYGSACTYLRTGMALLGSEGWTSRYDLAFGLWLERAECEYLSGNFDEAQRLIAELLARGASKIDKAAAYRIKIDLHVMQSENPKAVESALACLRLFGIEMPAHPTREQVDAEYEKVCSGLAGRPIESLIDLPLMTEPERQGAMRVLSCLFAPAYFTDFNLVCLHLCHMVNLSLRYGTTDASAHAYAWFGVILGPVFRRYTDGYRFGRLACDLVEKYDLLAYKAKTYFSMEMVALWTQPIPLALDCIRTAFRAGVETSDLGIACYSCNHTVTDLLTGGDLLDEVWRESERGLDFARKAKFRDVIDIIVSQQRFINNMRGRTTHFSTFSDATFDEDAFEAQLTGDRMATMVCWYWILKLQARFMSGDYEAALAAARKAQALLWSSDAHIQLLDYHYYTALAIAAAYATLPPDSQREWREVLAAHLVQLREWAQCCSATFRDKHALVAAETARLDGRTLDAENLYEEAIRLAREHGFVHTEGIANELAAQFYAARGFQTIARAYRRNARYCYQRWGAAGKVRQLDQLYQDLGEDEPAPDSRRTMGASIEHLELATVLKVSQAVSGEIEPEKLIDTLLRTAVEHAGAQRGLLIVPQGAELRIQAEATTGGSSITIDLRDAPVSGAELPEPVVRYAARTQESVILDDACARGSFISDEYILRKHARSVLCLPLMKQGKPVAFLYLENNLAPRVFTPARIAVLTFLASEAATSLENSRLYRELREREAKIRRLVDSNIVGIFIWDLEGQILEANDAFLRIVGFDREELVSGRMRWTDLTPREWLDRDQQRWVPQLKLTGALEPFQKEFFRKDGSRVCVLLGAAAFEENGRQGVAFVLDLTESKRAEAQARESERRYREMQTELAHANRAATMGQLTASIAHEVKQPIAATAANASAALSWLRAQPPNLEEVRQALVRITNDAMRAGDIIGGIRDLIKKAPPRRDSVDINEAVCEVIELTRGEAVKHGIAMQAVLGDGLPAIRGDRVQLQQVLLNLIVNAIEALSATSEGPRELLITTEADPSNGVLIAVRDRGPGLPALEVERIFNPFYTTKAGGLGMGLSICRSIVEAHGGRLWAGANAPRGAVFKFVLPGGKEKHPPTRADDDLPVT